MKIRFFGDVAFNRPYYETAVHLEDRDIEIDLNLDDVLGEKNWVFLYDEYISKVQLLRKDIEELIRKNFKGHGIVEEWLDYHIEELEISDEKVDGLLSEKNMKLPLKNKLFSLLNLRRIGLYPGNFDYAVWDFMLDGDLSDDILVVITDIEGNVKEITWESEGE
ncbi:DUF2004 domain-containing protein [Fusobacterium sp.]|uniref:DUF2004 domain-containing protein n=1 Tax=Fusobacterium sp. TaxID=68766 RepID=UPI00396CA8B5